MKGKTGRIQVTFLAVVIALFGVVGVNTMDIQAATSDTLTADIQNENT